MEDNTVTIRDRDTMEQERVTIAELNAIIDQKVNMKFLLMDWSTKMPLGGGAYWILLLFFLQRPSKLL